MIILEIEARLLRAQELGNLRARGTVTFESLGGS